MYILEKTKYILKNIKYIIENRKYLIFSIKSTEQHVMVTWTDCILIYSPTTPS